MTHNSGMIRAELTGIRTHLSALQDRMDRLLTADPERAVAGTPQAADLNPPADEVAADLHFALATAAVCARRTAASITRAESTPNHRRGTTGSVNFEGE